MESAPQSSPPTTGNRGVERLVGLIVVAAIVVAVAGRLAAFAAPGATEADHATTLSVSGTAPIVSEWRAGYAERWTANPEALALESSGPITNPESMGYGGQAQYVGRDDDRAMFSIASYPPSTYVPALDIGSGDVDWMVTTAGGCGDVTDGLMGCDSGYVTGRSADFYDASNGDLRASIDPRQSGAAVSEASEDSSGWSSGVVDGIPVASWAADFEYGQTLTFTMSRLDVDTESSAWQTTYRAPGYSVAEGRSAHGVLTTSGVAVNADTGEVYGDQGDGESIEWVAAATLQGVTPTDSEFTAPDGTLMHWLTSPALPVSTEELPELPIRVSAGAAIAFDPDDGDAEQWRVDVDPNRPDRHIAVHGDQIVLVEQQRGEDSGARVTLLDADTGSVAWTRLMAPLATEWWQEFTATFTSDGTPMIQASVIPPTDTTTMWPIDGGEIYMLEPSTGATMWSRSGSLADATIHSILRVPFAPDTESHDEILVDNLDGTVTLLEPGTTTEAPSDMPACPSGMEAVSWTQYEGGSVLLCSGEGSYDVVFADDDRSDWEPTELAFTAGGFRLTFTNSAEMTVQAGGSLVWFTDGDTTTVEPAAGWSTSYGGIDMSSVSDVQPCPSDSIPLSFSRYDDGYLLVCGTTDQGPSSLEFERDGKQYSGSDPTAVTGGFCADLPTGKVCVFPDEGAITEERDGAETSYPVLDGYSEGSGVSAADTGDEDDEDTSLAQLKALAKSDGASVELNGRWVAQLASKYVGVNDPLQETVEGSHTFAAKDILAEHMRLRSTTDATRVLLLDSRSYGKHTGYNGQPIFVTVALDPAFTDADAVQAWCEAQYPGKSGAALENVCLPSRLTP